MTNFNRINSWADETNNASSKDVREERPLSSETLQQFLRTPSRATSSAAGDQSPASAARSPQKTQQPHDPRRNFDTASQSSRGGRSQSRSSIPQNKGRSASRGRQQTPAHLTPEFLRLVAQAIESGGAQQRHGGHNASRGRSSSRPRGPPQGYQSPPQGTQSGRGRSLARSASQHRTRSSTKQKIAESLRPETFMGSIILHEAKDLGLTSLLAHFTNPAFSPKVEKEVGKISNKRFLVLTDTQEEFEEALNKGHDAVLYPRRYHCYLEQCLRSLTEKHHNEVLFSMLYHSIRVVEYETRPECSGKEFINEVCLVMDDSMQLVRRLETKYKDMLRSASLRGGATYDDIDENLHRLQGKFFPLVNRHYIIAAETIYEDDALISRNRNWFLERRAGLDGVQDTQMKKKYTITDLAG